MDGQFKIVLSDPAAFIDDYYRKLDTKALQQELLKLFREDSEMQFNGEEFRGARNIMGRLVSADVQTIEHILNSQDYQPLSKRDYLVSVLGTVSVNGGPKIKFSTIFVLEAIGARGFFIKYQIVRSNICEMLA